MFFPQKASRSEQKTRELSVYSCVSACFNPHMAAACYHHWCSSLHLGSAACQFSWSCFHMWAVFLLFFLPCILDTLFFQPELDIVLPAYVPACNDWLWQKRSLPPSLKKKKGGGGQWWPLRQLPFTISHASASPCNFISYCLCPSYLFSPLFTGNVKPFSLSPQLSSRIKHPLIPWALIVL